MQGLRWGELAGLQVGDRVMVPGPGLRLSRAVLASNGGGELNNSPPPSLFGTCPNCLLPSAYCLLTAAKLVSRQRLTPRRLMFRFDKRSASTYSVPLPHRL